MSLALIRAAFENRLKTWADSQSIPLALEGVAFNPPSTKHLRAYLLPAKTVSETLDDTARTLKGIFQVSIAIPLNVGVGQAQSLASSIAGLYQSRFTQGAITVYCSPISEGSIQQEPNFIVLPIRFEYQVQT